MHTGPVRVDFGAVLAQVRSAVAAIEPTDSVDALRADGVEVATAAVRFAGPGTALVGHRPVAFRSALLATGSEPAQPDLPGLAGAEPLASDDVWDLAELPGLLLVLGGGAIGCELGQACLRVATEKLCVDRDFLLAPSADRQLLSRCALSRMRLCGGPVVGRTPPEVCVLDGGRVVGLSRRPMSVPGGTISSILSSTSSGERPRRP